MRPVPSLTLFARANMSLDPVQTLADLVSLPSCNPMGRPVSGPEYFEFRVTEYLEKLFTRLKLPWVRQTIEPQRDNILARLDGDVPPDQGGAVLLFEAHQDTVPVDGMTINPFDPVIKDGRLYGRGSTDIKGGMAAMLAALARLAEEKPRGLPTIVMACCVNEEHGYSGAAQLRKLWEGGPNPFIPRRPNAAVVAEPTLLDVVVAHKGAVRWRCQTHGKAAHSSQPHLGDNAAYKMARVLLAIEAYNKDVAPTLGSHPLCGRATISVGIVQAGLSVNTVPDLCAIEIDRRLLPCEDGETAFRHVVDFVSRFPGVTFPVDHQRPWMMGSTLSDADNGSLAEKLASAARNRCGRGQKIGVPFGTDASRICVAGVPCVVFGPGSIDQAHTADEWLSLDELHKAADVLSDFARQFSTP